MGRTVGGRVCLPVRVKSQLQCGRASACTIRPFSKSAHYMSLQGQLYSAGLPSAHLLFVFSWLPTGFCGLLWYISVHFLAAEKSNVDGFSP